MFSQRITRSLIIAGILALLAAGMITPAANAQEPVNKPSLYEVIQTVNASDVNESEGICVNVLFLSRFVERAPAISTIFLPLLQKINQCSNADFSRYVGSVSFKTLQQGGMLLPEKTSRSEQMLVSGQYIPLIPSSYSIIENSEQAEMVDFFTRSQPDQISRWRIWKAFSVTATPSNFQPVNSASVPAVETPPFPQEALDSARSEYLKEYQAEAFAQFGPTDRFYLLPSTTASSKLLNEICTLPVVQGEYLDTIPEIIGSQITLFSSVRFERETLAVCPQLAAYKYVKWATFWAGLPASTQEKVDNTIWDKGIPQPYRVNLASQPVGGGAVVEDEWWVWPVAVVGGVIMMYFAPVMTQPGQLAPGMFFIVPEPIVTQ